MKILSAAFILISLIASAYYMVVGLTMPEMVFVYNKAGIPHWGIRVWALMLVVGAKSLLFPQSFKFGAVLLIMNLLFTITCFIMIKDWKGGFVEFVFLQIPLFLFWTGYPALVFEKFRSFFTNG